MVKAERSERAHWGWHLLGGVAVLAWAAAVGAGLWPSAEQGVLLGPAELEGAIRPGEWWLAASRDERPLGWVHTRVAPEGAGFVLSQESYLRVELGGLRQGVESSLEIHLGSAQELVRFAYRLSAGPLGAAVEGRMQAGGLALEAEIAGQRSARLLPLREPPLFDLALPYAVLRRSPQAGERFRALVFDPQSMQNREVIVEVIGADAVSVGGTIRPAHHLRRLALGQQVDSWLDAEGVVLKEELPGGLRFLRVDEERARSMAEGPSSGAIDLSSLLQLWPVRGEGRWGEGGPPPP